jgi:calcium-dependent protein kinase
MGCSPSLSKPSIYHTTKSVDTIYFLASTFINLNPKPFLDQYSVGRSLGTGTFGEVRFCTQTKTNARRAVKIFAKKELENKSLRFKFQNEINILKLLDHPNIVRVYEFFEDRKKCYIVMEHCRGGELFEDFMKVKKYREEECARIMRQVLSCVVYLHSIGVVHRDLKPENILLDEKSDYATVKLVDFGSAAFFDGRTLKERIGTPYYMAPEVAKGSYSNKCDEWSVGVLLYLMITGCPPFAGPNAADVIKAAKSFKFDTRIFESIEASDEVQELIGKLLQPEKTRITAAEALTHPWFKKYAFSSLEPRVLTSAFKNLHAYGSNIFKDAVRAYIATQLVGAEDIRQTKEIFKALDADGDGKLSRSELLAGYNKALTSENAEDAVDRIMQQVDTDGNGFIEYSEFLKAAIDKELMMTGNNLKVAFEMFDKDGNGKISPDELRMVLEKEETYGEEFWKEMVKQLDVNGDGEIDLKEFEDFLKG